MSDEPVVAILGGSLSGNKGAAAMLLAVADNITERIPTARVEAFSPYPAQDRRQRFHGDIVDFTPTDMLLRVLPPAVLSLLSMRRWTPRRGAGGRLARADVAVDVSGVAFMDGRGMATLAYNVLLVLLPWAFGVPVVKMAQALGPFDQLANRLAARFSLRRVRWIGLRGSETERHAKSLGLTNAEPAADISFLLHTDARAEERAASLLPDGAQVTLVAPSAVLERQCRESGIDYVSRISRLVEGLHSHGHDVVLIAHSARSDGEAGRTNDLPVCRLIADESAAPMIDAELDARVLRALIGRARLLVSSRFHAMISGLATGTPTFVVGWSHKYTEVLSEFGLDRWSVDFRVATDTHLLEDVLRLDRAAGDVRSTIEDHFPSVRRRAERNLAPVIEILSDIRR